MATLAETFTLPFMFTLIVLSCLTASILSWLDDTYPVKSIAGAWVMAFSKHVAWCVFGLIALLTFLGIALVW